jgi:hypothetical protein
LNLTGSLPTIRANYADRAIVDQRVAAVTQEYRDENIGHLVIAISIIESRRKVLVTLVLSFVNFLVASGVLWVITFIRRVFLAYHPSTRSNRSRKDSCIVVAQYTVLPVIALTPYRSFYYSYCEAFRSR